jgi:hypothetical protein
VAFGYPVEGFRMNLLLQVAELFDKTNNFVPGRQPPLRTPDFFQR